jgi:hypothetical protein
MDPEFLSTLTLMLIPSTPIYKLSENARFELPSVEGLLRELRIIVAESAPTDAVFRSNHTSNYLPIEGRLPRDREAILENIDAALSGDAPVRAEWFRGLQPEINHAAREGNSAPKELCRRVVAYAIGEDEALSVGCRGEAGYAPWGANYRACPSAASLRC